MSTHSSGTQGGAPLLQRVRRLLGKGATNHIPSDGPPSEIDGGEAFQTPLEEQFQTIERRLDDLAQGIETLQANVERTPLLRLPASDQETKTLQEALAALERQISRAGREQLKANALAETQLERLSDALEAMRTAEARHATELASLREQSRAAQAAARQEVVRAILPALDGLDEALRAGRRVLDQPTAPAPRPGFFARLRRRNAAPQQSTAPLHEAMEAWLVGLTYIRQRLLDVLAAEGVQPITAQGQPFDPRLHVALEVVPASEALPPGTVAAEIRRGYLAGDRVLRHAEVAVSRHEA